MDRKNNWNNWKEKMHWKTWRWYLLIIIGCLLVAVPALKLYSQRKEAQELKETNQLEKVVTENVQDYLASYVVTDGFVKTLTADADLQEELAEKISSNTSLLSEEQIDGIVEIAIDHYRMLSEMSIDDLNEKQIEALETSIHQNIESLLEQQQEDVSIVSYGVSAIIEKNLIRQLENMDASIEQLQKEIDAIKSNILGSKDLEGLNTSLTEMVENIDSINGHIAEVKEDMTSGDRELSQNIDTISADMDNLHGYCDETATVLIKIRAYMDDMNQASITSLSKEMENIFTILEAAADSIDRLNEKIPVIENNINEIRADQTDLSQLKKEIENIKSNVSSMAANISELKTLVQDNKKKTDELISDLQAEDIAILNKIDTLNKTFSTLQKEARDAINKLTTQMSAASKNISSLQTTTESALSDIETIKKEIESLQREKLAVIDVVNSLTVNDSSKALSAAMGYQLEQEIQALQGMVNEIEVVINNITNGEVDDSLQAQIDELKKTVQDCFTYVSEGKKDLSAALADKGVTVDAAADFDTFVSGIEQIGMDGSATENTILEGYSAYVENEYVVGEMAEVGNVDITLKAGEVYPVPEGYHYGEGTVKAASMESQTPGTATAAQLLENATAWVNGKLLTGTMKKQGTADAMLKAGEKCVLAAGYYSGGTVTAKDLASQTPGTAAAEYILSGVTAWSNGSMLTGTMKNNGAANAVLNAGDKCTLSAGYYSGGTIGAKDLASQTPGTASADNISAGKTAWVNGALVTGNGKDNNNSYEEGKNEAVPRIIKVSSFTDENTIDVNISSFENYSSFSTSNFFIEIEKLEVVGYSTAGHTGGGEGSGRLQKAYDSTTGVLSITFPTVSFVDGNSSGPHISVNCNNFSGNIYLIY